MQNPPEGAIPRTGGFFPWDGSSSLPIPLGFSMLFLLRARLQDALPRQPGTWGLGGAGAAAVMLFPREGAPAPSPNSASPSRISQAGYRTRCRHEVAWRWTGGGRGEHRLHPPPPLLPSGERGGGVLGRPGPLTAGRHFPSGYPRCAGASPARPPAGIFSANVNSNRLPSLLGVGVAEGMLIARGSASPWLFNSSPSLSLREERRHPRGL